MKPDPASPNCHSRPNDPDPERWVLVVRGDSRAVRRWLKAALRGYGIRCEAASTTTLTEQLEASRAEVLALEAEVLRLRRAVAPRMEPAAELARWKLGENQHSGGSAILPTQPEAAKLLLARAE